MEIALKNVRLADNAYSADRGWGFSEDALLEARDLVAAESPDATPLIGAIEEAAQGVDIYKSAANAGRRLIVATGWSKPGTAFPVEGLMYVEGRDFGRSTFATATVSQWVSAPGRFIPQAGHLRNRSMTSARVEDIRRLFYRKGIENWDEHHREQGEASNFWGLPVDSNTQVQPIGNQERDIQVPFFFGDWRDMLAVSGLRIPAEKKALIIAAVGGQHASDRLEALVKS